MIVSIWWLLALMDTRNIIPTPIMTFSYLEIHLTTILLHLFFSLWRISLAIISTLILGSTIGILSARIGTVDKVVTPLLYALYPIPKIAFLPLLMLFFGLGNLSKILLVGLILFFQIAIAVRDSVKNIPEGYFMSLRIYKATPWQRYRHIILPALLPQLFTAIRVSVGTSISVLFFAENYATTHGIGYYIMDSWLKLNYTAMFSGIVAISLMGTLIFAFIDYLESHFCRWLP
jgi:NitT/TauT family transport system permease protein